MNLPRAVFFDLDDTILSTDSKADLSWHECCELAANEFPALNAASLYSEIQEARARYWSDPVRHKLGRLNLFQARKEIVDSALARFGVPDFGLSEKIVLTYQRLLNEKMAPFPGALETLAWFRERRIPLALITNGSSEIQRGKIGRFQLEPFFDLVIIEEEFGVGKPEPAVFEHALQTFRLPPQSVWMVGDRLDWDIEVPQRLGLHGIWNDHRKIGLPKNPRVVPNRIVHAISELMR